MNLLDNAVKYTYKGSIKLYVELEELDSSLIKISV